MKNIKKISVFLAAVMLCASLLAGCGINKEATLITINGGEDTISLGYGNFLAHFTQAEYEVAYLDYFGSSMWSEDMFSTGNTAEQDVKDNILEQIEVQYLLKQHAADYGVELTADDESAIEAAADKFMEDNSDELIEQMGAEKQYIVDLLTYETYAIRVQKAIYAEADVTITDEEIEEAGDDYDEATLIEEKQSDYYDGIVDGFKEDIDWEVDEKQWAKVNFNYHYSMVETEEETAE